jgi:hypothetical protein
MERRRAVTAFGASVALAAGVIYAVHMMQTQEKEARCSHDAARSHFSVLPADPCRLQRMRQGVAKDLLRQQRCVAANPRVHARARARPRVRLHVNHHERWIELSAAGDNSTCPRLMLIDPKFSSSSGTEHGTSKTVSVRWSHSDATEDSRGRSSPLLPLAIGRNGCGASKPEINSVKWIAPSSRQGSAPCPKHQHAMGWPFLKAEERKPAASIGSDEVRVRIVAGLSP